MIGCVLGGSAGRTLRPPDMRAFTSPLPIGGHHSLLKQQLRDLVLRRKSLGKTGSYLQLISNLHSKSGTDVFSAQYKFKIFLPLQMNPPQIKKISEKQVLL